MPIDGPSEQRTRHALRQAFASVAMPTSIGDMLQERCRVSEDAAAMAAAFVGRQWTTLAARELFVHREMLHTLAPAAYRACLPAYLDAAIAHDDATRSYGPDLREYVLATLDHRSRKRAVASAMDQRLGVLDARQRAAVARVLRYLVEQWESHDAAAVLAGWPRDDEIDAMTRKTEPSEDARAKVPASEPARLLRRPGRVNHADREPEPSAAAATRATARDELHRVIAAAFPRNAITAAEAFTHAGGSYPDASEYRAAIEGRTWDELDHAYLVRRADALGFLGTQVLIAVLPVYLRALVDDGAATDAADMLTIVLRRPGGGRGPGLGRRRFVALLDALNGAQRTAIARVLADLVDRYEDSSPGERARVTLDSCWRAYLPAANPDADPDPDGERA